MSIVKSVGCRVIYDNLYGARVVVTKCAEKRMKIKITREDIRNAKEARRKFDARETWTYSRADTCPVALALKRLFPGSHVSVSEWRIYFNRRPIKLTKSVADFIAETDRKKDRVRPRELEIGDVGE